MRKKNLGNSVTIKAVALGLSAILTVSQPLAVFAQDAQTTVAPEVEAVNQATEDTADSTKAISDAQKAVKDAGIESETLSTKLSEGSGAVGDTKEDLEDAAENMEDALKLAGESEDKATQATDSIITIFGGEDSTATIVVGKLENFDAAAETTDNAAGSATTNAQKANNASSEDEAIAAKSAANTDLNNAVKGLADADQALADAEEEYKKAQENYNEAVAKSKDAQAKVETAQKALEDANTDVATAEKALKDAQEEAERLAKEVENAYNAQKNAGLDAIQEQYEIVKKYVDEQKKANKSFETNEYWSMTRKLCNLIIQHYIYDTTDVTFDGNFSVDLITGWEKDGDPTVRHDENGDVICDDNGELFWQEYKEQISQYSESQNFPGYTDGWFSANGNKDNRVQVTYTDAEGNKVTKYFNYKANDDGTIYIYEREYHIVDDKIFIEPITPVAGVEGQEAIEPKDAVPESWKTADGEKTFDESEYTNKVNKGDDESDGFYAINTEADNSVVVEHEVDDLSEKKVNNSTITYEKSDKDPVVEYAYEAYDKPTGEYNKKPQTDKISNNINEDNIESVAQNYIDQGYEVHAYYNHLIWGDIEIPITGPNWWQSIKGTIKGLVGINPLFITVTSQVDDHDNPILAPADGVVETVKQEYVEVVTTTADKKENSTTYDSRTVSDAKAKRDAAAEDAKRALESQNTEYHYYKNIVCKPEQEDYWVNEGEWYWPDLKKYTRYSYTLTYTEVTITKGQPVEKVVSKKVYAADTYTQYEPGSPAVEGREAVEAVEQVIGQDAYYSQKLVWTSDNESIKAAEDNGSIVYADKLDKLTDYNTAREELKAKMDAYDKAKKAVSDAHEKVEELQKQIAQLSNVAVDNTERITVLESMLEEARGALDDAKETRDDLAEKVKTAKAVVNAISLDRFRDDDSSDDEGGDDDTSATTGTAATGTADSTEIATGTTLATGATGQTTVTNVSAGAADQGSVSIGNNDMPLSDGSGVDAGAEKVAEKNEKVKLNDGEVPLAATPSEKGVELSWLWLLLVLLAVITGMAIYENQKKKARKNANKG